MKTFVSSLAGCLLLGGVLVSAPAVLGQDTRFYIKGDLGGNVTEDTHLKEFFGVPLRDAKVKFDPGVRAGFAGGYQLTDWFAPEVETGIMANEISSITGASRLRDASFVNIPFLVNGKFQLPNSTPLTPYAGAGVGFSESIIDVHPITIGGTTVRGNDSDTVFAYQFFAGLRYRLNDRMGLGVEYRYFGAESPTWEGRFHHGAGNDMMSFGHTRTHAVSIAFDFRF